MRKGVYPYEHMDNWEKLDGTSLPEKEDFYSQLNMEDITDTDCTHGKRVCKDFEVKDLGEFHDLYVQSDIYCYLMYLITFGICVLKYMSLVLLIFFLHQN